MDPLKKHLVFNLSLYVVTNKGKKVYVQPWVRYRPIAETPFKVLNETLHVVTQEVG